MHASVKLLPGSQIGDVVHHKVGSEIVNDHLVWVTVHEHLWVDVRRHVGDLVLVPSGHDEHPARCYYFVAAASRRRPVCGFAHHDSRLVPDDDLATRGRHVPERERAVLQKGRGRGRIFPDEGIMRS